MHVGVAFFVSIHPRMAIYAEDYSEILQVALVSLLLFVGSFC